MANPDDAIFERMVEGDGCVGISPEDARYLQTRQFLREQIASWPHKVGILKDATFSNMEGDDGESG